MEIVSYVHLEKNTFLIRLTTFSSSDPFSLQKILLPEGTPISASRPIISQSPSYTVNEIAAPFLPNPDGIRFLNNHLSKPLLFVFTYGK
jgi:hypothetical protein